MTELTQKKAALRLEMKAHRKALDDLGGDLGDNRVVRQIAVNILRLPEIAGDVQRGIKASRNEPHMVAGFYPIQTEVDGLFILKALNAIQCRCALPVVTGKNLFFKEWDLEETLKDGPYGTREPDPQRANVKPDIILVPLLAFDERGNRLGYGGGFYDRTLEFYRREGHEFTAIGLAYDGQLRHDIPVGDNDQPLDIIVTEQKVYRP
ncbi:5-formyltetrahydrofolate cyclo-ligase [hydrothermal vent metagenome]|uniref:5-formyltetrahydrofolate cyclo-ligase n=1 Tax=hydrothermal vent metagenome TaxID=652676 RepID=A0A3B1B6D2_9ZZZZ